jgi:hypothetical protein
MTADDLLRLKHRQPFVPFRLHLADGRTRDVLNRRLLLVEREFAVIGVPPHDSSGTIAQYIVNIRLADVVRTEDLQPAGRTG